MWELLKRENKWKKANFGEILVLLQHFNPAPGPGAGAGHLCWAGFGFGFGDSPVVAVALLPAEPGDGSATSAGTRSSQVAANFGCCSHLPLEMQLETAVI